jgi:hypothetical protein
MSKALLSMGVFAFQWALLFVALWQNRAWAWNCFVFLMWFSTVAAVFIAISRAKGHDFGKRPLGRGLPAFSDFVIALILASFGHFWYATLAIVQLSCEWAAFEPKEVKK